MITVPCGVPVGGVRSGSSRHGKRGPWKSGSAASGQNRWRLSRDFRLLFGTSPYRYLTMRRLERCKRSLAQGLGLAEASLAAGFADQSHMTRQFRDAYGISPGRWLKLTAQASGQSRERG